jgi:hypothetical protein
LKNEETGFKQLLLNQIAIIQPLKIHLSQISLIRSDLKQLSAVSQQKKQSTDNYTLSVYSAKSVACFHRSKQDLG